MFQKSSGGKKLLIALLVVWMFGTLAGCGADGDLDKTGDQTATTRSTAGQTEPTEGAQTDPSEETEPADPTVDEEEPGTEPTETEPTEPAQVLFEYQVLYGINSDLVGWMEIPGTTIDYPVVQSPYEANFYLRRNFYKEGATCGTLYAREKCDVFKPADNITIYGHKMSNGTMFADLHLYKDPAFWEENKYIRFDTIYEYHTYEIFAVFVSTADLTIGYPYHIFDDADDAEDYDAFVSKVREMALYDTGIIPQYGEKLITLSTCDKSIDQGRLVVVARCIE